MLTANDDIQGIFGINDPTALGATLALGQASREDVWVVGVDGSPEEQYVFSLYFVPLRTAAQPDVLQKIRDGKVQAAGAVIGAVMKAMRGQADAGRVREIVLARASN